MERKSYGLLMVLAALALAFIAQPSGALGEISCEICYAKSCIPVYEDYGFQHCNENYTYTTAFYNELMNPPRWIVNTYTICKAVSPCLTPPPF